jgi:hypothetical protein
VRALHALPQRGRIDQPLAAREPVARRDRHQPQPRLAQQRAEDVGILVDELGARLDDRRPARRRPGRQHRAAASVRLWDVESQVRASVPE